jgi:hypothetical protein
MHVLFTAYAADAASKPHHQHCLSTTLKPRPRHGCDNLGSNIQLLKTFLISNQPYSVQLAAQEYQNMSLFYVDARGPVLRHRNKPILTDNSGHQGRATASTYMLAPQTETMHQTIIQHPSQSLHHANHLSTSAYNSYCWIFPCFTH